MKSVFSFFFFCGLHRGGKGLEGMGGDEVVVSVVRRAKGWAGRTGVGSRRIIEGV